MKLFEDKLFYTHKDEHAYKGLTSWEKISLLDKILFIILNLRKFWDELRKIYK